MGQGNTIAFNLDDGVQIDGLHSTGNGILSNRIFANGGSGDRSRGPERSAT